VVSKLGSFPVAPTIKIMGLARFASPYFFDYHLRKTLNKSSNQFLRHAYIT